MSLAIVTGSTGLVGSEAVNFFHDKGFDVIGIDNNLRKFFFGKNGSTSWLKTQLLKRNKNFKNYNLDIRNMVGLKKIFKRYSKSISVIIHCAAQPSHDYGKKFPFLDFNVNATGTLNLLELTKKYSPDAPFIFMSTNKVYEKNTRWELKKSDKDYKGIKENFSIDNATHSFFGVSKTYADLIVQEYGKNVGLKTVCFRGGCITGPNHSGASLHGFLSYLVKASLHQKKYNLIGYKGTQVRDNLHSYDLVNSFWEFYKKPKKGEVYTIKRKILKTPRVGDHIWYISDTTKLKKHYPKWKQKYNTKKIIEELISNFK